MSNIKPDSIIACLDCPDHVQAVLDASMWVAKILSAPIGLLYAIPNKHYKEAVDYSGCLLGNDDNQMLSKFAIEEYENNGKARDQGRMLLKQSGSYCQQQSYDHNTYVLHRHSTIAESLSYVATTAQFIVIGHEVTCKHTLSQLIRPTKCPILVTHGEFVPPKTALFAFDNRHTCHALLDWLCTTILVRDMTVHIVMVGKETEQNKDALREAYARLKQAGITCKKKLIDCRDVVSTLIYYQHHSNLDLMISGAFSESRIHQLIKGSETCKLLDASKSPYILFPSKV